MKNISAKVVGVMYNNEKRYGGRNRQDIIKEIYENRGDEVILGAHYMERKNGEGEAVCLYDLKTNQIVGWLGKEVSATITKRNHPKYYLGKIGYHGVYHINVESLSEKKMLEMQSQTVA